MKNSLLFCHLDIKKCEAKEEKKKVTIQEIYLLELLFSSSYVDIESANPVFSDLMNKCKQAQKERKAKNTFF